MADPRISILIPAYNEASVIARCLDALALEPGQTEIEVIVIANGCKDDTVGIARTAMPEARVIDTPIGGKTRAMNIGVDRARGTILAFLDADLTLSAREISELADRMENDGTNAACGQMRVGLRGASAAVRAFYGVWAQNTYFDQGKLGGFYLLTRAKVDQLFPLPAVTNDDEYIRRHLRSNEITFDPGVSFVAEAPRTLSALIKVRTRVQRGNAELVRMGVLPHRKVKNRSNFLSRVVFRPDLWAGFCVYLGVGARVRLSGLLARNKSSARQWERDDTTRADPLGKALPR